MVRRSGKFPGHGLAIPKKFTRVVMRHAKYFHRHLPPPPPQVIARLELDNLATIENAVRDAMGCGAYHKHMTIPELWDNFADKI